MLKDIGPLVLARKGRQCNFIEYKGIKTLICYVNYMLRYQNCIQKVLFDQEGESIDLGRYASLYFIAGIDDEENELLALEIIHRYVEALDRYFGNVLCLEIMQSYDCRSVSSI